MTRIALLPSLYPPSLGGVEELTRHLALAPDGRVLFCANQRSAAVAVFRVDPADGSLSATGAVFTVDQPAHVAVAA